MRSNISSSLSANLHVALLLESHISSNLTQVSRCSSLIIGFSTFTNTLAVLANVTVETHVVHFKLCNKLSRSSYGRERK